MHTIIGVGCDLVEIDRIKKASQTEAFIARILLPEEIAYCQNYKDPSTHIAARFAAKEAVSKALGCGIGKELSWHDISISLNACKKPHVSLSPQAQLRFPGIQFEISLSHTEQTACAFVIAFKS